jgi:uncharacterized protein
MDKTKECCMRTIFIIHGSFGNPEENWFPWLKHELEKLGHRVFVPEFPIPKDDVEGHNLDKWLQEFEQYKQHVNKETIFVAHSRGCSFLFQLLPRLNIKIDRLYLIGPFIDYDQWRPEVYIEYDSFQSQPYLWKKIRTLVNKIDVYQSTNDVIPISEGQFISDCLRANMHLIKNAGHFNVANNPKYIQFELLLSDINTHL